MIYLDHNATTPVDPEVSDAVLDALRRDFANPSSTHAAGRQARGSLEQARASVSRFLGASSPDEIIFLSGGTEANNLAIMGTLLRHASGHIVTSAIEHPSVLNVCRRLASCGYDVTFVSADGSGMVDPDDVRKSFRPDTILCSLMHANNETGVLQPVAAVSAAAREQGITFHVDAAQTVGKMPFSLSGVPADLVTVVPHKFYGPKGISCLYVRRGIGLAPFLYGAGHERGLRPGTENVPGAMGFAKACDIAGRDMRLRVTHTLRLRDLLYDLLREKIPGLSLNGHPTERLPNTLNVVIPGVVSSRLLSEIAERVAASSGSACHEGACVPSPVLKDMGLADKDALSSVRLSVGKDNTEAEIRDAAHVIAVAVTRLRKPS